MATDTVSQDTTPAAHNPQTDPPAPSMFAPDSVKQNYNKFVTQRAEAPQINQGQQPEVEEPEGWEDPNERWQIPEAPSPEDWNEQNPMPREEDFDEDQDGKLDEYERRKYEEYLDAWAKAFERWLRQRERDTWRQNRPRRDDYRSWEEWRRAWEEWHRGNPDGYYPQRPEDIRGDEDWDYWHDIFEQILKGYGVDNPSHPYFRELYEYWWDYRKWQEGGQQGDPPQPPRIR